MSCTPPNIASAEYCQSFENEVAGISHFVKVIPIGNIASGPDWTLVNGAVNSTISLTSGSNIVDLPCVIEKNNFIVKGKKGGYDGTLKLRLQNTTLNRSVVHQLRKSRALLIIKDLATGEELILGRNETGQQLGCKIDPDTILHEWGEEFGSDRFSDFTFIIPQNLPEKWAGSLQYELLLTGAFLQQAGIFPAPQGFTLMQSKSIDGEENITGMQYSTDGVNFQNAVYELDISMGTYPTLADPVNTLVFTAEMVPGNHTLHLTDNTGLDLQNLDSSGFVLKILYTNYLNVN
ncbi:hypothetical protein [Jiulongibacter sediminis]|uniref:hypothetical protein n=1 Tax=Jiulongibacter sediminis TaxID=1605367 RepID=UPI0026EA0D67|nr:hypothetical protein [Jiulongibacter sediminis]